MSAARRALGLAAALLTILVWAAPARAAPTIAVDLDPSTAGLQSSLTVEPGDLFTVAVVYVSDGLASFDTIALGLAFNDSGPVLGLGPSSGDPRQGALAGLATTSALDSGSLSGAVAGDPMTRFDTFSPPAGFASGVGAFGFEATGGGFFSVGGAGTVAGIMALTFEALIPGDSLVCPNPFIDPTPFVDPIPFFLTSGGTGVRALALDATVTVTPEPATLLLLGTGLAGLGLLRRRIM